MTWVLLVLADHPEIQERAREEILQILPPGGDTELTWEALEKLEFCTYVIKETLRSEPHRHVPKYLDIVRGSGLEFLDMQNEEKNIFKSLTVHYFYAQLRYCDGLLSGVHPFVRSFLNQGPV